jgi:hypothetical protein
MAKTSTSPDEQVMGETGNETDTAKTPHASGKHPKGKKEKPLLHLVKGERDPELFSPDLDWYYGVFDSECGLKGIEAMADAAVLAGYQIRGTAPDDGGEPLRVKRMVYVRQDPIPYDGRHARLALEEVTPDKHGRVRGPGSFTRGRRIWNRLVRLPYDIQLDLRSIYEPRRDRRPLPEWRVRAAHRAYLEGSRASA